ncbi:MAG: zinc-ribbon domain-containing protein [Fimbriiglobus sp.]|nr:zinc-ribbon domain-containing protein [Fimbriiglobus sp.]
MSTRAVNCPNCQKSIQVPAEAAGKKIKCKACQHIFPVPGDGPAKPAVARPVAKPVARPASPPPPPPPPAPEANAPIPFKDDDDEELVPGQQAKGYGVNIDPSEDVPRCPFCAKDLDPPDTKICLNCGYDMEQRKRHRTVKTYQLTSGDYIKWWLPAVIWAFVLINCAWPTVASFFTLEDQWRKNEIMLNEESNKLTGKKEFFVHPMACSVCCSLVWLGLAGWGVPVIVKRIKQPKPTEVEKKK